MRLTRLFQRSFSTAAGMVIRLTVAVLFILTLLHCKAVAEEEPPFSLKTSFSHSKGVAGKEITLFLLLQIKEGFHLFTHTPPLTYLRPTDLRLILPKGITTGEFTYPPGKRVMVKALGKEMEVYEGTALLKVPLRLSPAIAPGAYRLEGSLSYQACSDQLCLRPARYPFTSTLAIAKPGEKVTPLKRPQSMEGQRKEGGQQSGISGIQERKEATAEPRGDLPGEATGLEKMMREKGLFLSLLLIFLGGLALNLTPCVYPMIPVTVSIFLRQGERGVGSALFLASLYLLGLATTYSLLGTLASLTGQLFGSLMQSQAVSVIIALLFSLLALSMFGIYELRLPSSLTSALSSQKQGAAGIFLMGAVVGAIAAPCIGPFVLAMLVYVGKLADPVRGFLLFFVLSLGLGLPYLFLALFSSQLKNLPRAGEWLLATRKIFGVAMLALALYYLRGVIPAPFFPFVIGILFLGLALIWGFQLSPARGESLQEGEAGRAKAGSLLKWEFLTRRGGGVILALLAGWFFYQGSLHQQRGIPWQSNLEQAMEQAKSEGRPVIIDFYSGIWCPACLEMERITYRDPRVVASFKRFIPVQIDVDHHPGAKEIMDRYRIRGIPTVIFQSPSGQEMTRAVGFVKPEDFLRLLQKI